MTTRKIPRQLRADVRSPLTVHLLVMTTLALGAAACSSEDGAAAPRPPAAPAPPAAGDAPSPPAETPSVGEPPAAEAGGDVAAGAPSEGQQASDLAPPVEPSDGQSSPASPAPGEDAPEGDGEPAAADPSATDPSAAVPSAGCGQTRTLQDGTQTIASGGVNRTYLLETPDAYDNAVPHRVVFMFHWNYGSINAIVNPPDADQNTDLPFYGMGELADDRTIFVVPQGLVGPTGGAGWDNPNGRDVTFTDDMLDALSADLCIDTSRVFTTGFSYGAGMSLALACVRPDRFRAAVAYAPAFISGVTPAQCTTPIAFFGSHGVDDPIISYQTGLGALDTFASLNGCSGAPPPEPPTDGHACVSLDGCTTPTRFCNFGAGQGNPFNTSLRGHYPSSKDPGQSTSWVPAEAWSFISQF